MVQAAGALRFHERQYLERDRLGKYLGKVAQLCPKGVTCTCVAYDKKLKQQTAALVKSSLKKA